MTRPNTKPRPEITSDDELARIMREVLEVEAILGTPPQELREPPPKMPLVILAPKRKNTMPGTTRVLGAARIRVEAEANKLMNRPDHAVQADLRHAEKLEAGAVEAAGPEAFPQGAGGEIIPHGNGYVATAGYIDTVKNPSLVAAEASRARMDLANNAGVLSEMLDLCDTIGAENSMERMAASQMAIMNKISLLAGRQACECLEQVSGAIDRKFREECSIHAQRYTNTASRAAAEFQNCAATIQRLRTGGKQNITVTHIQNTQVNDGGKAVVTSGVGRIDNGGGK